METYPAFKELNFSTFPLFIITALIAGTVRYYAFIKDADVDEVHKYKSEYTSKWASSRENLSSGFPTM